MPQMLSASPNAGSVGGPSCLAGEVGESAHRLGERAETRAAGVGTVLPESRHPDQHQARVEFPQPIGSQAPFLQRARAEVLYHDIRGGCQAAEHLRALWHAEVKSHRPLVTADFLPPQRHAVLLPAMAAHGIP